MKKYFYLLSVISCINWCCNSKIESNEKDNSNKNCQIKTPFANLMEFKIEGAIKLKESVESKEKEIIKQILRDTLKEAIIKWHSEKYFDLLFDKCTFFSLTYDIGCGESQIDGAYSNKQLTFIISRGGKRDFYFLQVEGGLKEIYFQRYFDGNTNEDKPQKRTMSIVLGYKIGIYMDEGYTDWSVYKDK
jgi:hypothetical protein